MNKQNREGEGKMPAAPTSPSPFKGVPNKGFKKK